jgi:hypothetical protein
MPVVNDLDSKIAVLIYGQRTITYTTQEFPTRNALVKLDPEEQIAIVCERYKLWMLEIADGLTENPNAGYAILAILNSYFDMIAQLSGYMGTPKDRVKHGLKMVFPELQNDLGIVDLLEDRLRNPMAHMGITKDNIILIDLYDDPLVWGNFRAVEAIVINPRLWVRKIRTHFERFTLELFDPSPQYDQLRQDFLNRIARTV